MNMLSKNKALNQKMFFLMTLISCIALGVLISCSEKSGTGRGILIEASEESGTIPTLDQFRDALLSRLQERLEISVEEGKLTRDELMAYEKNRALAGRI